MEHVHRKKELTKVKHNLTKELSHRKQRRNKLLFQQTTLSKTLIHYARNRLTETLIHYASLFEITTYKRKKQIFII